MCTTGVSSTAVPADEAAAAAQVCIWDHREAYLHEAPGFSCLNGVGFFLMYFGYLFFLHLGQDHEQGLC